MNKLLSRFFFRRRQLVRFSSSERKTPTSYCVDLVKKHDYENYLCTLLLPSNQRSTAFAIRAFNIEVANVGSQVSEPHLGQMRLKFWEETVEKIYADKSPQHPVALELHRVLKKDTLSKNHLRQLVTIRTERITSTSFATIEHMERYAERSTSPVYYLILIASGIESTKADHAFSHLGKAQGLTNLIRSVPYHAQRRVVVLPHDLLIENKVSQESVFRGGCEKSLRDVVFAVASQANTHLEKAKSLKLEVPESVQQLLLPLVPTANYLERLRCVDFDVFHPSLQLRDHNLPVKLWWKRLTGGY